jgi:hypothetical protein
VTNSGNKAKSATLDFLSDDITETEFKKQLAQIEKKNKEANWYNVSIAVLTMCLRDDEPSNRQFQAKKATIELFSQHDMKRAFANETVEKVLDS